VARNGMCSGEWNAVNVGLEEYINQ
jgi:hypothetical protein